MQNREMTTHQVEILRSKLTHIVRHYMENHGMRTKTSPHARVRVEVGDEPPGEATALPS